MRLPTPRGELSARVVADLRSTTSPTSPADPLRATGDESPDDLHLTLWVLHELHYRGFEDVPAEREWDPALIALRNGLEQRLERWLRDLVADDLAEVAAHEEAGLVAQLEHLTRHQPGALAHHLQRHATVEHYREFLVQRSVYHLKESDPHAWALPRLTGAAKVALAELLHDEYGAGVPTHLHSRLYADAMAAAGLDPAYGAYLDDVSWQTLAFNNAMTFFGLHRRWRGAVMGHLAAFEMASSLPCRRYLQAAERLGFDEPVLRYFDEHVEADAVHEHLAARGICQAMVEEQPALRDDVLLGAAACVRLDDLAAGQMLESWQAGGRSLRRGGDPTDDRSAA